MKSTGIIFTILYLQASASFLDNFRSTMSNVERGFGKLITDVVTDVKDTIHCTMSAFEQVLVLNGLLDKTSTYSYRCRDLRKTIEPTPLTPSKVRDQRSVFDLFSRMKYPDHKLDHRNSTRHISMEFENSITNANKTINEILKRHQIHSNHKIVPKIMKDDTNRLTEISDVLKRELENLSSNIRFQIDQLRFDRIESSIDSIWNEIKALHNIQQSSKNNTEISEIRNILDKIIEKLNLNSDYKGPGNYNLKEIRKKLQKCTDSDDKHIKKGFGANSSIPVSSYTSETENKPITFKDVTQKIINRKKKMNSNVQSTTRKSIFNLEMDTLDYFTPFLKSNAPNKKTVNDAKKVIEDSQHTDKILNDFFNERRRGLNVFSTPELNI